MKSTKQKQVFVVSVLFLFFLSSCSTQYQKEKIIPLKETCNQQGKIFVYDESTKEARCDLIAKDAGKRCTKTTDCEGYCEGSNASTSSGTCSKSPEPSGCVTIIERGERFERCFNNP